MSAPLEPARTRVAARRALIRARTGLDPVPILLLPIGVIVYAYYAQGAELLGQSTLAVAISCVLATLCSAGMLIRPTADRLELFRVFSFWYLMAFCIGPIFEPAITFFRFDDPKPLLLERVTALALASYVAVAIGYHLPLYRTTPKLVLARHDEYDARLASMIGLALWAVGTAAFVALFVFAGGAAVILRGEGGLQRTEFSFGLGWWYWLMLGMVSGGAVYFAAQASRRSLFAWVHAWPLIGAFLLLLLLQGRHRAIMPIMVMLAISNYLIRPIRLPRLLVYGTVGLALAIVMNVARSPAFRGTFFSDPVYFTVEVLKNFEEDAKGELAGGIGRVDEVMLVVDHVPDRMPYDWGKSLTLPLNPFFRLIGRDYLQSDNIGNRLYDISRPDMRDSPYRTGILPSIVGEMRTNFPFPLCLLPMLAFGMLMRFVYQRLVLTRSDFVSIAAYAIIGLFLCNNVIDAIGQVVFELGVLVIPIFLVRRFVRRRGRRPRTNEPFRAPLPAPGA